MENYTPLERRLLDENGRLQAELETAKKGNEAMAELLKQWEKQVSAEVDRLYYMPFAADLYEDACKKLNEIKSVLTSCGHTL